MRTRPEFRTRQGGIRQGVSAGALESGQAKRPSTSTFSASSRPSNDAPVSVKALLLFFGGCFVFSMCLLLLVRNIYLGPNSDVMNAAQVRIKSSPLSISHLPCMSLVPGGIRDLTERPNEVGPGEAPRTF